MLHRLTQLKNALREHVEPNYAERAASFFKTGKGDYAEGERFLGIRKPVLRQLVKPYQNLDYASVDKLLGSTWHEEKVAAMLLLLLKYRHGSLAEQKKVYQYYAKNRIRVNNWDLVDDSAAAIVGHYHFSNQFALPRSWITETNLWSRRIVIVASHYHIKQDQYQETIYFAEQVMQDQEDLIHKATGWMLRELGKRSMPTLQKFLDKYYQSMPRTMLRYAIEHIQGAQREFYMRRI